MNLMAKDLNGTAFINNYFVHGNLIDEFLPSITVKQVSTLKTNPSYKVTLYLSENVGK